MRILRDERLKRYVLEINIALDQNIKIEKEAVAKLFSCMGLKAGPGGDLAYNFRLSCKAILYPTGSYGGSWGYVLNIIPCVSA